MAELTQEYFDRVIKTLATKTDITTINERIGKQTKELKKHAEEQTEALARIIAKTVVDPMDRHFREVKEELALKKRMETVEKELKKIKQALSLA